MRRYLFVYLMLTLSVVSAWSGDPAVLLYFKADSDGGAKVVNALTGNAQPVIAAVGGKKPANCPPDAYWSVDEDALFRCKDGAKFRLIQIKPGTVMLDSIQKIPGTDDPGPSRKVK
ncbi:hypothetical protein [Mesorhizobium sp. M4B.F.Ca.ET.017.02.2.1]|uniref:hypothetical protein n=1 Tax=Mesorhizobium sp. M4B.F.Ca.ET.017.02.2.1 TaxID=2496649 RepID=UPI000FCC4CBA|nr:hypothetical protein [Mesorhizobium sp. M4B.F.Ca.ET.017.02.2.1]RVD16995.1 hypothetical protein EN738_29270 [Mesorhizobium sp. M4B.F.Ca.ET.017.02.2.1]